MLRYGIIQVSNVHDLANLRVGREHEHGHEHELTLVVRVHGLLLRVLRGEQRPRPRRLRLRLRTQQPAEVHLAHACDTSHSITDTLCIRNGRGAHSSSAFNACRSRQTSYRVSS